MSEKTEALRLADELEMWTLGEPAADELRRLHAENKSLRQIVHDFPPVEAELREVSDRAHRLEAQRDALLEALKKAAENGCPTVYANEHDECGERGCCGMVSYKPHADDCWVITARAAIKKAEEA